MSTVTKPTIGQRIRGFLSGLEGAWRGPFYGIGERGGSFELGALEDGWQRNLEVSRFDAVRVPVVEAIRHLHRSAFAQFRIEHHRIADSGRREVVRTSAASRIAIRPNPIQTWSEFASQGVDLVVVEGEAIAVAARNDRYEVASLFWMPRHSAMPYVAQDGSVFYSVGANQLTPEITDMMVPARDVLHWTWATPRHPLKGESALASVGLAAGVHQALSRNQAIFFNRMSRPSGVISVEGPMVLEQFARMRQQWEAQSARLAAGGVPILSNGAKFTPMTISSEDSQLIEAQRMSNEEIAKAYGVPPPLVGDLSHATLQNVESLTRHWLAISLGGLIEKFERSLDRLFDLDTFTNRMELDVSTLMRVDFAARLQALGEAVRNGIYMPDEARAVESLSPVPGGNRCYMQQQMVPLGTTPAPAGAAPAPEPEPEPDDAGKALAERAREATRAAIRRARAGSR